MYLWRTVYDVNMDDICEYINQWTGYKIIKISQTYGYTIYYKTDNNVPATVIKMKRKHSDLRK